MPKAAAVGPRLSVMMFLEFFIWGSWYVTVGNYMTAIGMAESIGWVYTVGPIAAIISPFFLGMVADRYFATERVLGAMHLLGGAALLLAPMMADVSVENWAQVVKDRSSFSPRSGMPCSKAPTWTRCWARFWSWSSPTSPPNAA